MLGKQVRMAGGKPLRIAVIDDSVVVRRLVADALRGDPQIVEVKTAGDGKAGAALVKDMRPDLVTMDIEMPVMNGIEAVRVIRTFDRKVPIIMFSTLTDAGARATLDAFSAGATDFVTKPGQARSIGASLLAVRSELLPKIIALADPGVTPRPSAARTTAATAQRTPTASGRPFAGAPKLVAIGSSTGGPEALSRLLSRLPADLGVPIVVTQHMPPMFTRLLADRLDAACKLRVTEAVDNATIEPGTVTVAAGGKHLVVVRDGGRLRVRLLDSAPVNSCKPSVDVMLASLTAAVGSAVLTIILTGMGSDGAQGALGLAATGGRVWAQDAASSVVWGMPGATIATGVVERVMPLDGLAAALIRACRPGHAAATTHVADPMFATAPRHAGSVLTAPGRKP